MDISYQDLVQAFNAENAKDDKALICNKKYLCIPESTWSDEEAEANAKARISRRLSMTAINIYDPADRHEGFLQLSFDRDIGMVSLQLMLSKSILDEKIVETSVSIVDCRIVKQNKTHK